MCQMLINPLKSGTQDYFAGVYLTCDYLQVLVDLLLLMHLLVSTFRGVDTTILAET